MPDERVVVIGAGVGGLVSAALLAARGCDVTLVEAAAAPGGKLRAVRVGGGAVDGGPTVFTLRDVFEEIFADVRRSLDDHLDDAPRDDARAARLGRRAARSVRRPGSERGRDRRFRRGGGGARLSRVPRRSEAAVRRARPAVPARHQDRSAHARLADGRARLSPIICNLRAYTSLWRALGGYFRDPRLRQLFGRYATYCGSSPFALPGDADADRACRGERRVADRRRDAPAGARARGARARARRALPLRRAGRARSWSSAAARPASCWRAASGSPPTRSSATPIPPRSARARSAQRRGARPRAVAAAAPLAQRDGVDRARARPPASRWRATTCSSRTTTRPSSPRSPPGGWPMRPASMSARRTATTPMRRARPAASASRSSSTRPPTGDGAALTPAEIDRCTQAMLAQRFAGGAFARSGAVDGADDPARLRARCFRRRVEPFMDRPRTGGRPPSAGRAAGRGSLGSIARAGAPTPARASRWRRFPAG